MGYHDQSPVFKMIDFPCCSVKIFDFKRRKMARANPFSLVLSHLARTNS